MGLIGNQSPHGSSNALMMKMDANTAAVKGDMQVAKLARAKLRESRNKLSMG